MIINNCHSITKHCLKLVLVHVWYSRVCIIQEPNRHLFLRNSCKQKGIKHLSYSVTRNEHGISIQILIDRFWVWNLMISFQINDSWEICQKIYSVQWTQSSGNAILNAETKSQIIIRLNLWIYSKHRDVIIRNMGLLGM